MSIALDEFATDPEMWVAVITGAGEKAFCSGMDLRYQAEHGLDPEAFPASGFGGLTHRRNLSKPVIAAVNGAALGGGLELVLACDLVVADKRARFGLPEPRVGTIAAAGGLARLPRQVGIKRAAEMALTGSLIDATTLHVWGAVNRVVGPGEALAAERGGGADAAATADRGAAEDK
jgi:enoyl-CoA hydratase/carnithine racemase